MLLPRHACSPCLPLYLSLSLSLPLLIAIFTIVLILFVANKIGGKFDDVVVARFVPYAPLRVLQHS